jgi:hypothetical protein
MPVCNHLDACANDLLSDCFPCLLRAPALLHSELSSLLAYLGLLRLLSPVVALTVSMNVQA